MKLSRPVWINWKLTYPLFEEKKVGLIGNQNSVVGEDLEHLDDVLVREDVDLQVDFALEKPITSCIIILRK